MIFSFDMLSKMFLSNSIDGKELLDLVHIVNFHLVHGRNLFGTPLCHRIWSYKANLPLQKKCLYSEFFYSECGKIRTRKTPNTHAFYVVFVCLRLLSNPGYTIAPHDIILGAIIYLRRIDLLSKMKHPINKVLFISCIT